MGVPVPRRGQRIYTIDRSNRDEALAALNLSSNTISEIRQAVNAGRVVTTHTDPVMVPGWQGAGYVVLDPETGSGAWLIEGGLNGGFLALPEFLVELFWGVVQFAFGGAGFLAAKVKQFYDSLVATIVVFRDCPVDVAIAAFASIAFIMKGFTFGSFGVLASALIATKILYFAAVMALVGAVLYGFSRSCK